MPADPHSIMGDTYLSQRGCLRGCDRHANWDLKRRIDCCENAAGANADLTPGRYAARTNSARITSGVTTARNGPASGAANAVLARVQVRGSERLINEFVQMERAKTAFCFQVCTTRVGS